MKKCNSCTRLKKKNLTKIIFKIKDFNEKKKKREISQVKLEELFKKWLKH